MTSAIATRFVDGLPLERFELITVDGRTIRVPHSDYVSLERFGLELIIYFDDGRSEFIDVALIVSIRTIDLISDPER